MVLKRNRFRWNSQVENLPWLMLLCDWRFDVDFVAVAAKAFLGVIIVVIFDWNLR